MSKTINLGAVTAYADAVAAGYTGTREQFAQDLANAANYAAESHQSAETASAAAETASTAAETATTAAASASDDATTAHADAEAALSFKESAETAAGTATTKAGEAANSASQAATSASGAAGSATAASGSATAAAGSATNAAESETAAAGSATAAAGSASAAAQTLVDVNTAGATQVAAIAAKGAEVLESIPSDYTELSQDVDDLKSDLEQTQAQLINGYIDNSIYVSGATNRIGVILSNSKRCTTEIAYQLIAGDTISVSSIDSGLKCAIAGANNEAFIYDSGWLTTDGEYTVQTGKDGLYFVNIGKINEEDLSPSEITTLKVRIETFAYSGAIKKLQKDISDLQNANDDFITPSVNLADPSKFTKNKFMTDAGVVGNSNSYYYTDKIPVAEGDVIYVSPAPRYKTAFNGDSVVSATITFPWTVPSGIDGLIITGYTSSIDSLMITKNKQYPFMPYGDYIKNDYLRIENQNALNGNDGITIEMDTVEADTTVEITDYPKIIAAHDRLSGYCKFSTIDEILFGYGYGRNKYCGVTDTNINIYVDGALSTSIPHGITISDYLAFSIVMDDNRVGQITINSTGGTATATISLSYAKNGLPFIRSTTALENVKLSAICKDIKNPIWWFGDSYSSLAPERIIGQLNNYGIIGNMLIDAVPGGRSYSNETTGGYIEFLKLTKLAKPKYVIWALGMNDNDANYNLYLTLVKNYCDINGISLYAVKIPSVPSIDNTAKGTFIDTLELPSIDWAKAVNATAQGVWYAGYLSSDNVHPTIAGAKAMAARTIVDCPAIMQF